jgi:hypothetical protein
MVVSRHVYILQLGSAKRPRNSFTLEKAASGFVVHCNHSEFLPPLRSWANLASPVACQLRTSVLSEGADSLELKAKQSPIVHPFAFVIDALCLHMEGTSIIRYFGREWNLVLEQEIKQLCPFSFADCESLASVTFRSITTICRIDHYACRNCSSLKSICIPASVEIHGWAVFLPLQVTCECDIRIWGQNWSNWGRNIC